MKAKWLRYSLEFSKKKLRKVVRAHVPKDRWQPLMRPSQLAVRCGHALHLWPGSLGIADYPPLATLGEVQRTESILMITGLVVLLRRYISEAGDSKGYAD